MNKDQKARKALEWDKKEVYEADAKQYMKLMKKKKSKHTAKSQIGKTN